MAKKKKTPRKTTGSPRTEQEIERILQDISKEIMVGTGMEKQQQEAILLVKNKQRNATNPRLPYPFKRQLKGNQVDVKENMMTTPNYLNRNQTGCAACRRRLWDPV